MPMRKQKTACRSWDVSRAWLLGEASVTSFCQSGSNNISDTTRDLGTTLSKLDHLVHYDTASACEQFRKDSYPLVAAYDVAQLYRFARRSAAKGMLHKIYGLGHKSYKRIAICPSREDNLRRHAWPIDLKMIPALQHCIPPWFLLP